MKTKKTVRILITVLLVALIALLATGHLMDVLEEVTFYWFDHTETELKVKAYAEEHRIFFSEYPESFIALLERNPETETFVLEYPRWEKTEYDLSDFEDWDGVPLFMQWDQRWGYETYGSDVIGITGCGPTCLAMAGYYLTGEERFTPEKIAAFSLENGHYEKGYGSAWTLISQGAEDLGLAAKELPLVKQKMVDALEAGNPIILAMGKGDFTSTGHYIVLAGMEDGAFVVNDPNSYANSAKLWTYEELEGQIKNIWEISK